MPELVRYGREDGAVVAFDQGHRGESLGVGFTEGEIQRIPVTVFGKEGNSRKISIAEKLIYEEDPKKRSLLVQQLSRNHNELRKRNITTFPTFRVENDGTNMNVYMTDLTEGGKNEVIAIADFTYSRNRPGREGKFFESNPTFHFANPQEFSSQCISLYKSTVEKGVHLHNSDVFFAVHNQASKRAQLLLGDLRSISFSLEDYLQRPDAQNNAMILIARNYIITEQFMYTLNLYLDKESQSDTQILLNERNSLLNMYGEATSDALEANGSNS